MENKYTKSKPSRPRRKKRSTRRSEAQPKDEVISFQVGIREALVSQIRDAVTAMAEDLVMTEAQEFAREPREASPWLAEA